MKNASSALLCTACLTLAIRTSLAQAPTLLISGDNQFMHIEDFEPDPNVEGEYLRLGEFKPLSLYLDSNPAPYKVPAGDLNLIDFSIVLDFDGRPVFIKVNHIDSAVWKDFKVINSKHLSSSDEEERLMLLVEAGSKTYLYKEQKKDLLPPTYNETLQIGNKKYTLESSTRFYLLDGSGQLLELSKSLKSFKSKSYFSELKRRVKSERWDLKKEEDIRRLADYMDELEGD